MRRRLRDLLFAALLAPAVVSAQPAAGPTVRRIATASAVSTERLQSVQGVRELPDGRVLVNDPASRRLLLMDTTLRVVRVVLDSLADVENSYGLRGGRLLPYRGDSTLFVDPASYVMLVLDRDARLARVRSVPRVQDVGEYAGGDGPAAGQPGVDPRGRLVHGARVRSDGPGVGRRRQAMPTLLREPDSAFVVAVELDTRRADTLAAVRVPRNVLRFRSQPGGGVNITPRIDPLPVTDDWALLADGTVAIVRAVDYHVDFLAPDGTRTASGKLPYAWQRLTDSAKARIVDSVRAQRQRASAMQYATAMVRWVNTWRRPYPPDFRAPDGFALPGGLRRDARLPDGVRFPPNYLYACAQGEEPTLLPAPPGSAAAQAGGIPSCVPTPAAGGTAPPAPTLREVDVVDPQELPDYVPPLAPNTARGDADGNLWLRPVPPRPTPGGAIYDVIARDGTLADRIQLPQGYTLAGFGRGRVVYLTVRDAAGLHLARVRLAERRAG